MEGFPNGTLTSGYRHLDGPSGAGPVFKYNYGYKWIKVQDGSFIVIGKDYKHFMLLGFMDDLKINHKIEYDLAQFEQTANLQCLDGKVLSKYNLFLFCVKDENTVSLVKFDISTTSAEIKALGEFPLDIKYDFFQKKFTADQTYHGMHIFE